MNDFSINFNLWNNVQKREQIVGSNGERKHDWMKNLTKSEWREV